MPQRRGNLLVSCIVLSLFGCHAFAEETGWFKGLVESADHARSSASALDASRLGISSPSPHWSGEFVSPWSADARLGTIQIDPAATLQLASPTTRIDAYAWKIGAGAGATVSRASGTAPLFISAGPVISMSSAVRFAGAATFESSPSERLRAIELAGRLRGNERSAVDRLLSAANLASLSAASSADAIFAGAKAAFLEKEARRVEIDFGRGLQSYSQLAQSQDVWTRAKLEVEDLRYNAESFGRQARAASFAPSPEASAAFDAEDLYLIATKLEALFGSADPATMAVASAVAEAAAPWDLRASELAVEALGKAPLLGMTMDLKAMPTKTLPLSPSAAGTLSLSIPLGSSAAELDQKTAMVESLRKEAVDSATASASLRFSEAQRAMELRSARIIRLKGLATDRETRAKAWAKLVEAGTVTLLDSLAAASSLAEAQASLKREKSGYFLATVSAFTVSGLPLSAFSTFFEATPAGAMP
ncbi:MAG: hypothetical protein WCQ50_02130 [Spirochaetota bacterium]